MEKYCAVIFDIIDSRKYENRYDVQRVVKDSIEYLNTIFAKEIVKDVIFGAGDEFQGLFYTAEAAFLYARKLQLLIYPVKVRCGIGYGSIKYIEEKWSSTEIDGEAYYNAREAIISIPNKRNSIIFFKLDSEFDKYINMYSLANTEIKSNQSQMVKLIELLVDITCPLMNKKCLYNYENAKFYEKLLKLKVGLIVEKINNRNVYNYEERTIDINNHLLYEVCEWGKVQNIDDSGLFIDCYWERGLSSLLADIINTSRQNVDKHISLGKVKESRNMDCTILMMLGDNLW